MNFPRPKTYPVDRLRDSPGMAPRSASCHVRQPVDVPSPSPSLRFPNPAGGAEGDLAAFLSDVPSGAVVELAPGRFRGPLHIERPVTIKGAGDLTRIEGDGRSAVVSVDVAAADLVYFESLTIADGAGPRGGGLAVEAGRVRLFNVVVRDCRADDAGGGIWVGGGELEARLLRLHGLSAERGGAVAVGGRARFAVFDGEVRESHARLGGAACFVEGARVKLSGVTFGRTRATGAGGGQVVWVGGATDGELFVELERVRFEDVPLGQPLVVQPERPGRVMLFECDVPSSVFGNPGIVDGGNNTWR